MREMERVVTELSRGSEAVLGGTAPSQGLRALPSWGSVYTGALGRLEQLPRL